MGIPVDHAGNRIVRAAMSAQFYAFDGIDGVGKTTQVQLLARRLEQLRLQAALVSLRSVEGRLPAAEDCPPDEEVEWFAAAWNKLITTVITPLLCAGETVITDRYVLSFFAYQSWHTPLSRLVQKLEPNWPRPDAYFVLDAPVELATARCGTRKTSVENSALSPLARVDDRRQASAAEMFRTLGREYAIVVDSSDSIAAVGASVWAHVRRLIDTCDAK